MCSLIPNIFYPLKNLISHYGPELVRRVFLSSPYGLSSSWPDCTALPNPMVLLRALKLESFDVLWLEVGISSPLSTYTPWTNHEMVRVHRTGRSWWFTLLYVLTLTSPAPGMQQPSTPTLAPCLRRWLPPHKPFFDNKPCCTKK